MEIYLDHAATTPLRPEVLEEIKKDLDNFRVNFDLFTSEQSLYDKGSVFGFW